MIRLETVESPDRLWELETAWQALWTRADGNVFQRFDWVGAWWRAAGQRSGCRLNVVVAWREDELVALAALVTRKFRGMRVLEWAAKDCSDYCDILIAPGLDNQAVLASIWQHVSTSSRFDVAYLSHLQERANTQLLQRIGVAKSVRLRPSRRVALATGINLADWTSSKAWFQSLGKKGRNNHTRGLRILETGGPVSFRLLERDEDIALALDRICALKQRWADERQVASPVLRDGAVLLRELVLTLARIGSLRLFVLECDKQIVAASINIIERDRLLAFFAAYDPEFERASPGTLIMVEYIRWSIDNSLAMVDFLCGDEGYKDRFADIRGQLASFTGARTPLGWLAITAETWAGNTKPPLSRFVQATTAKLRGVARRRSGFRQTAPTSDSQAVA